MFYEDAIAPTQGFSQTFLDVLTPFDATICLITDSSHPIIPTFSPQDPPRSNLYLPGCNTPYYKTSR
ncbi:NACHT C-terminal alpha/beta 1 domain-containing protein [Microcoleus sp. MOSTC5]|uniref:NACHT C-terminal alpha/beta 1 domain-containing protein n=1 Tax=Microcoleus sp. MOSTC5 TaxID=3055378 RepID=UPI00404098FE